MFLITTVGKGEPRRTTELFDRHVRHKCNYFVSEVKDKVWILALFLFLAFVFILVGLFLTHRVEFHVTPKAGEQLRSLVFDLMS